MSGFVAGLGAQAWARPRRRLAWRRLLLPLASAAGHVLRAGHLVVLHAPGLAGAGLISFGAWLAWPPAGFAVLGLFALLVDRRVAKR